MGQIKINFKADIILVDITSPHHQPVNNVISNLVYASKSSDVYLTMCGGKILYYNGKYNIGEDINKIYEENRKIREKLSKRG